MNDFETQKNLETQAEREDPFEITGKKIDALLEDQPEGSLQVIAFSDAITLWSTQLARSNRPYGDKYKVIDADFQFAAVSETIRNRILSPQGTEYKIAQEISNDLLTSCVDAFDNPHNPYGTGSSVVKIAQEKLSERIDRLVSERAKNLGDE